MTDIQLYETPELLKELTSRHDAVSMALLTSHGVEGCTRVVSDGAPEAHVVLIAAQCRTLAERLEVEPLLLLALVRDAVGAFDNKEKMSLGLKRRMGLD